MASYRELVATAEVEGCRDADMFAEWLCDDRQHFGNPDLMSETDLESAWIEARGWWEQAQKDKEFKK